jgi:guanylate kinase
MSGSLFIVSAPSGAGKTSLVAALLAADPAVHKSISYTTRAPRPGEADGREYHFVSDAVFAQMADRGEFLEHAVVHGNRYGTGRSWVEAQAALGHDIVFEIDWQGAAHIRRLAPEAISVFILPPSLDALEARLKARGQDDPEVIARRVMNARDEIRHVDEFDYVIINEDFNRAARELASIFEAERLRRSRQLVRHADLINRLK